MYRNYNMINDNEKIKLLLWNKFQIRTYNGGAIEYYKNEISFYFPRQNEIIIEFNPQGYFHVFFQISSLTLDALLFFVELEKLERTALISHFTQKNFLNNIRNYYDKHKNKI